MQAHIQQTYMRYLSLHTLCVARAYGITKDSKQPFANLGRRPKPAGLARARSYLHLGISTITKLLPMHHLQLFISCIHACFALHVCTTPPVQKQATMSICVCPLTSGRQAGNKLHLALALAFDKAYLSYHHHHAHTQQQAHTHARTNVSPHASPPFCAR